MKSRTDVETIVSAVQAARRVLSKYIEPGPCDSAATVERLLELLDTQDIEDALRRIDLRNTFELVSVDA
jgi:hypothetical protein